MADVRVIVTVDPDKDTTIEIKSFAAELAKSGQTGTVKPMLTGSATVTYNDGKVDGDATVD
jgi:hypothetical protein